MYFQFTFISLCKLKTIIMFRIIKKPQGYIVETKKYYWSLFGLKYKWIPYVKTSGLDSAWHHSTYEYAIMNLTTQVKEDLD